MVCLKNPGRISVFSHFWSIWVILRSQSQKFGAAGLLIWCQISNLCIRGRKSYLQIKKIGNIDFFEVTYWVIFLIQSLYFAD